MSRAKRVETAPVANTALAEGEAPLLPEGDPLKWTVEEWLRAGGVPIEKVREELDKQAESRGAIGIPAKLALNIWNTHATPARLAEASLLLVSGLVQISTTGQGPHGHSGVELAG